ncbi:TPMT family class I SAM-dependent methyltransferase [Belliella sp. DSM 107340]|uniref:TPMT family class I SAM-dependent methyltransferase n=1 Tax=Belliella calami TaxID=2923436 RepID=A0ABS9UIZ0_9BACT|nr:TPMT family class I SAM-dependent methyltransferase [Belliella calami]MCH7396592.1 TPMT family class I SAM-dependent methyltransferase [Belliella calami]
MNLSLDEQYWTSRYLQNQIGWDVGQATFPIKQYLDQIENKDLKVLIPGAGNAHEAAYALEFGFKNIHILDLSKYPLDKFIENQPTFPPSNLHHQDFFLHQGNYDLIIEQTFFCALSPSQRIDYVKKMHQLLKKDGVLMGVLFNRYFEQEGPPFGGDIDLYKSIFENHFEIKILEPCYNSVPPRRGAEVFILLKKKEV